MTPKIFCPQPLPDSTLRKLHEYGEVEVWPFSHRSISIAELESACARSDYVFCIHSTPITASMVAANTSLLGFGVQGVREDLHDVAALEAAGVPLLVADEGSMYGYGRNRRATADLLLAHVLCLAYRVNEADRFCRANGYFQEMTMDFMGVGCFGKTVSLYGLGKLGRHVVPRLRSLEMTVLYTKRHRLPAAEEAELDVEWVADTDELIARGDYVCMLANWEESNRKLMGAREFALMKPSAYFVNVARGWLVDEDALIAALRNGTIAGAGLEVFWNEPPLTIDPYIPLALRKLDNVVLTPHNGGATHDSRSAQFDAIADVIIADIVASAR
jgi:glyoxylate reductase